MKITEDGQGKFAVYEDGEVTQHLDKCAGCNSPVIIWLTMVLRLHGVKQQASLISPDGPLCIDCMDAQIANMEREGLR